MRSRDDHGINLARGNQLLIILEGFRQLKTPSARGLTVRYGRHLSSANFPVADRSGMARTHIVYIDDTDAHGK